MNTSEPIIVVDSSKILDGKLEEVKTAIGELAAFVEANEPRTVAYRVHLSRDGSRMTVIQVHVDSASMEFHMRTAGPAFAKFERLIELLTLDIYGKPSDALLQQLTQKAQKLGHATITEHSPQAGFARFGAA
jgi:quinol monooxygenase YgiN